MDNFRVGQIVRIKKEFWQIEVRFGYNPPIMGNMRILAGTISPILKIDFIREIVFLESSPISCFSFAWIEPVEDQVQEESASTHQCTCDIMILMAKGCQCGGV